MVLVGCSVSASLFTLLYLEMTFTVPSYKEQCRADHKIHMYTHTHPSVIKCVTFVRCHHLKTIIPWMVMQLDMKRDGKCQSEAFGSRWFLLFQSDALRGSQGDFWDDNKAKQLPGMV